MTANSASMTEWPGDLLGGVTVIKGEFAHGSKLLAAPNYARLNRDRDLPPEAGPMAADLSYFLGTNAKTPPTSLDSQAARQQLSPASTV